MSKDFFDYFNENMEAMHLPAPRGFFGTLTKASASIGAMAAYVQKFGTEATVKEMVKTLEGAVRGAGGGAVGVATATSEVALIVAGCSAAFYVGACIGSLAVATGKTFSGGLSISDCFATANEYQIPTGSWLEKTLHGNPVILNRNKIPGFTAAAIA